MSATLPRLLAVVSVALGALAARAENALDAAIALAEAKKFPEARAAFEKILAAEPRNATACHELGLVIKERGDDAAYEEALKWLARAMEIEPANPVYLADFGGTSLQLADRTRSISAATKGRDAMEKAVSLDPGYLDAHEGLVQFYLRAPLWLGSNAKAAAHLAEIRKRDPDRATELSITEKIYAKEYDAAFALCEETLAKHPNSYIALYYYGRAAGLTGQNIERGIERLKKCLAQEPPSPAAPTHSYVWLRLGNLQENVKRFADARAAYQTALKLDPGNKKAADALAKLP